MINEEYLRRNRIHAKSVGVQAGIEAILKRVKSHKKQPAWMVRILENELVKTIDICHELAMHRAETVITKLKGE